MAQYKTKSRQQLPNKRRVKHNHSTKKRHYFELINSIPTKDGDGFSFKTEEDEYKIANMILMFLEDKFPEELSTLNFNKKKHNISSIIDKCNSLVREKGMLISLQNPEYVDELEYITIYYEVPFMEYTWFILEMKHIELIPEELKPAFARICEKVSIETSREDLDFYMHGYKDLNDSPISQYDWMFEEREEDFNSEVKSLTEYQKQIDSLKKYAKKDLTESRNYIPKNKIEKKLKEILFQGIDEIDFACWNYFDNSSDEHDGELGYKETLMLFWDSNDWFECKILSTLNEVGNNGQLLPIASYVVDEEEIIQKVTPEQVIEFGEFQKYFVELCDILYINEENRKTRRR